MTRDLLNNTKIIGVAGGSVAGTTAVNGAIIDMQGWQGVLFIANLGALTATSALQLKAQQASVNSGGSMADIANAITALYTAAGTEPAGSIIVLDLWQPFQRFVRPVLLRATANAVVNSIVAIQYMGVKVPAALDATVLAALRALPAS